MSISFVPTSRPRPFSSMSSVEVASQIASRASANAPSATSFFTFAERVSMAALICALRNSTSQAAFLFCRSATVAAVSLSIRAFSAPVPNCRKAVDSVRSASFVAGFASGFRSGATFESNFVAMSFAAPSVQS